MAGTLFVVSTPIGNLEDMTQRALRVLSEVDVVAAEDTRRSGVMLDALGIKARLVSCHDHNEDERSGQLVAQILQGQSVALISDAGTPLVSDPGYRLVRACQQAGIEVVPVPGASAVLAALAVAGLPTDRFLFEGFLPSKGGAREEALSKVLAHSTTTVLFEAPHRLLSLLGSMEAAGAGEREITLCRELTKRFETVIRSTVSALRERVAEDADQQKGEVVLVLAGATPGQARDAELEPLARLLLAELPVSRAARVLASVSGRKRQAVYDWLEQLSAGG
ncbi:16S rRNA (cytidine(1402)-2'-O)-methyltransferase [Alcanivorax quisquiliarum]|uniref:Ribosomal RNA small subunit methyltransferase I n=1 Tax=Alcanivorax quisquiliarum TaxID=2933565 RepID=A0ABT0E8J1_9GAMM|nr:16S rRNA (cytidine(1402)-2'-O)-methyltransferase [Alcanivorax quisquiliarum]MCK0537942.1 16S rRNA (cytidine(1402)-2'-O)-methyltransferase [Alcanivorax quisquiliarum]